MFDKILEDEQKRKGFVARVVSSWSLVRSFWNLESERNEQMSSCVSRRSV